MVAIIAKKFIRKKLKSAHVSFKRTKVPKAFEKLGKSHTLPEVTFGGRFLWKRLNESPVASVAKQSSSEPHLS